MRDVAGGLSKARTVLRRMQLVNPGRQGYRSGSSQGGDRDAAVAAMAGLTIGERAQVARLATAAAGRRTMASLLGSPLLSWRYGAPHADALTMLPQELRPADPSFVDEVAQGQFGLADALPASIPGSPFDLHPPTMAWAEALHGFGWLRHFSAANSEAAAVAARALVDGWMGYGALRHREAWHPAVAGRRIQSWLSNAGLLLENVDQRTFDRTAQSLVAQLTWLSAHWRSAPAGLPRLQALIGLVFGDLCIAGHETHLKVAERHLSEELGRQILPDGGHVSRNAAVLVEVLLDLLPLRQCYLIRCRALPAGLEAAMQRMLPMLRYMRHGDGALARFNGVGAAPVAELAVVLAYDTTADGPPTDAPQSRYARLQHGGVVVIADVGPPPPLALSGQAHAGCLSFELSAGQHEIVVNGGAPAGADPGQRAAARGTASHSTLVLGDRSSSRLIRHPWLERTLGAAGLAGPTRVTSRVERSAEGSVLEADHDGYARALGMVHRRTMALSADGSRLDGVDHISGARGPTRLARDVPYAVRFHLHPKVGCEIDAAGLAHLRLVDGTVWTFSATGAQLSLEPSMHYADPAGVVRSRQIVLRGACWGETSVEWRLERRPA